MRLLALVGVLVAGVVGSSIFAQKIPQPRGHLNDFANIIDASLEPEFERALTLFEAESTVQIAVVTVPDLQGYSIEEFAVELFEQWGIGQKDIDNGVLLLYARAENRIRIEVGYGMEPYLTDGQAGRILDNEVLPDLRQGNYGPALLKGSRAIVQTIRDSGYEPGAVRPRFPQIGAGKLWIILPLAILSLYVISYIGRTREVALGAIWGLGAGAIAGWVLAAGLAILFGAIAGGVLGLLLDVVLSRSYKQLVRANRPTGFRSSWGGFGGGGVGGGWRGGGGSFGGFGGGRSGGGGASR